MFSINAFDFFISLLNDLVFISWSTVAVYSSEHRERNIVTWRKSSCLQPDLWQSVDGARRKEGNRRRQQFLCSALLFVVVLLLYVSPPPVSSFSHLFLQSVNK